MLVSACTTMPIPDQSELSGEVTTEIISGSYDVSLYGFTEMMYAWEIFGFKYGYSNPRYLSWITGSVEAYQNNVNKIANRILGEFDKAGFETISDDIDLFSEDKKQGRIQLFAQVDNVYSNMQRSSAEDMQTSVRWVVFDSLTQKIILDKVYTYRIFAEGNDYRKRKREDEFYLEHHVAMTARMLINDPEFREQVISEGKSVRSSLFD